MWRRLAKHPRDQERSSFTDILDRLLDAVPGAIAVSLVDNWGESVDYSGALSPFDARVAAAHLQLEVRKVAASFEETTGPIRQLIIRTGSRTFVARNLDAGYTIVLVLGRCSSFTVSERAMSQIECELREEAGFKTTRSAERWVHARVEANRRKNWRPLKILLSGSWQPVEVMGTVVGLAKGEKGYRVRTQAGAEMTLVREKQGRWYADMRFE